jgi:hypothetical protein
MPTLPALLHRAAFVALAVTALAACEKSSPSPEKTGSAASPSKAPSRPPAEAMLPPADLAKTLADPAAKKPTILFVGPEQLFVKHVPGAKNAGEAGNGTAELEKMAAPLARDAELVIYCGCCPPRNCPNIKPAYAKLVEMGFTKVKVLDLPLTFRADWRDKGYPVEG